MVKRIAACFLAVFTGGALASVLKIGPCQLALRSEPCDSPYIRFHLFTRRGPGEGQQVSFTQTSDTLKSSLFEPGNPNKIIIHGYNAHMELYSLQDIKNEYVIEMDCNVWMINWPELAAGPSLCYQAAVYNAAFVGRCLALMIKRLRIACGRAPDVHVIGYSLGAHVPAEAALSLKPYIIPRITGLEPCTMGILGRTFLSRESAAFVDVIHTNGLMQGVMKPQGHADFYMNGGIVQPGCARSDPSNWLNCDHVRAPEYFSESIFSRDGFWGLKCEEFFYKGGICNTTNQEPVLAGEYVDTRIRGSFLVETAAEFPYALGKEKLLKQQRTS